MARPTVPDFAPWRRQPLTIPPNTVRTWLALAVWELWMGVLLSGALTVGIRLIATAPNNIVTVFDLTQCYASPPIVQPCERVASKAGMMNVVFNAWCGLLMLIVAAWLVWELWSAVAPKPITDDFLKLLDDSFGRSWRDPRPWRWSRMRGAYGFTAVGVLLAASTALLIWTAVSFRRPVPVPV